MHSAGRRPAVRGTVHASRRLRAARATAPTARLPRPVPRRSTPVPVRSVPDGRQKTPPRDARRRRQVRRSRTTSGAGAESARSDRPASGCHAPAGRPPRVVATTNRSRRRCAAPVLAGCAASRSRARRCRPTRRIARRMFRRGQLGDGSSRTRPGCAECRRAHRARMPLAPCGRPDSARRPLERRARRTKRAAQPVRRRRGRRWGRSHAFS